MKNPLVDALREAQTGASDDPSVNSNDANDAAIELSTDVPVTEQIGQQEDNLSAAEPTLAPEVDDEPDVSGLDLLQTGSLSPAVSDVPSSVEEFIDGPTNESADVREAALPAEEEDPTFSTEEDDSSDLMTMPVAALSDRGGERFNRTPLIPKLGRLSPIFCLVALSVSAGGYYIVNIVAAKSLNEDLDGMARRMQETVPRSNDEIESGTSINLSKLVVANSGIEPSFTSLDQSASTQVASSNAKGSGDAHDSAQSALLHTINEQSNVSITALAADMSRVRDRAHAFVKNAYAAYQIKDYGLAEANYLRALEVEPHHVDALAGIAAVYLQTDRTAAALAGYEKLLSVDPGSAIATSAILAIHADDAKWDSESELKLLLQRYPGAHQLHYALGSVFVGEGRWPDARQSFLAAYRLAPNNATYSYNTAVSMEKVGDQKAARLYYEVALESAGQDSNIDRNAVIAHLKTLNAGRGDQL